MSTVEQLFDAFSQNNESLVTRLVTNHPSVIHAVNKKDGYSSLARAAYKGYIGVCTILLNNEALINEFHEGATVTPLYAAATYGQKEMCKYLIEKGWPSCCYKQE